MGQDVSANISFGIDLGDENPFSEMEGVEDLEDLLTKGLTNPYSNSDSTQEDRDQWRRDKEAIEKACPIEIDHYGSESYWSYILHIRGTRVDGGWERPVEVCPPDMIVDPQKVKEAAQFCEEHGLPAFKNPSWLLYGSLW